MENIEYVQDLLEKLEKMKNKDKYTNVESEIKEYFKDGFDSLIKEDDFKITTEGNINKRIIITKKEAENGCTKILSYTKLDSFHKKIKVKIDLKIPKNIKNGNQIVLRGEGSCMKGRYSDLIVKVTIR